MQTTENSNVTHVHGLLPAEAQRNGDPAPKIEAGYDSQMIFLELIHEEAELRWRADALEAQAQSLDDGDDESRMQAGKLRIKRSEELGLADEISQTATQIKADPTRKIPRARIAALESHMSGIIDEGAHESEAATVVQASAKEHKATIQHAVSHHQAHEELPEKIHKPAVKKSAAKK